jgi:hypothetical protein
LNELFSVTAIRQHPTGHLTSGLFCPETYFRLHERPMPITLLPSTPYVHLCICAFEASTDIFSLVSLEVFELKFVVDRESCHDWSIV